jgi:membrane-bound lytic murein transglycosylase D
MADQPQGPGLMPRTASDRRRADRRAGPRASGDRRKRDRRRFLRVGAGLIAATTAFAGGVRTQIHRREHPVRAPQSSGLLITPPGVEPVDDEQAPPIVTHADPLSIALNEPVLKYINAYRGTRSRDFTEALARGGRYLDHMQKVFVEEGVPAELAYVALVESEFKTDAVSSARASGLWQFMPRTGKHLGLAQDSWVDERSDPEEATRAAAKYLKYLHNRFDDWNLALAAYNAGEGTVQKAINRHGTRDFWTLVERRAFSKETREYVPKIHAAIKVAQAPESYGLEVELEDPLKGEALPTEESVDLRVVAECAGTDLEELKLLNPGLRRLMTPTNRPFELKVPEGTADEAAACLASIPANKKVRLHVVRKGQTLSTVAKKYGTNAKTLAQANRISTKSRLSLGTELIIPPDVTSAD